MADELVHLTRRDDGVALVELDNGKANTLSGALLDQLGAVAAALTDDPPGAVVVTGRGRMFAAGAEIAEFGGPDEAEAITAAFHAALDAVAAIPRAVIAADSARLGQPEILLGIIPGGGGTQRLARLVGPSRAKDLILTGRQVRAEEAATMGLVDRVVPADDLLDAALATAAELAAGPLTAHALAKQAIDGGLDGTLADGLALERALFVDVFRTEDAGIGVASFLEHGPGKADFTGR